ncbi:MAG: DUF721 domain-containing protein [Desulfobulbaceae bacterium]|nr:DUF721 domain-containing protein [Desulfobulbaceae bacterium]
MSYQNDSDYNFVAFSSLLPKIIYQKEWQKKIILHRAFTVWESVVDPKMLPYTRPLVIHGRTLWIEVSDSIRMQQLNYLKYDLLQKINEKIKPQYLEDIRYRQNVLVSPSKELPVLSEKIPVDPVKKREFNHLLGSVHDGECRDALEKLWTAFATHRKYKKS